MQKEVLVKRDQLMPGPVPNEPPRLRKPLDAEGVRLGGKGKISIEEDAKEEPDEERNADLLLRILRQKPQRISNPPKR